MNVESSSMPVGVYAVVVTYFPERDVIQNLEALAAQVERVVIVDNGSLPSQVEMLRAFAFRTGADLVENVRNLGIAQALNTGAARARNARWLLLFDQDSRITSNFVRNMCNFAMTMDAGTKAALFVPRYYDMRFHHQLPAVLAPDGTLAVAMTSGSMLRPSLLDEAGPFIDWFVYEIDYEFSMRLRTLGYTIHECSEATLLHSPASPEPVRIFGRKIFYTRNYKPLTRYYMQRNGQWLRRLYGGSFPEYFHDKRLANIKEFAVVLLAETDKWKKIAAMIRGYRDGRRLSVPKI